MASPQTETEQKLPGLGPLQYGLIATGLLVAFGMLVLGAMYSGGEDPGPVISGGPVDGGGDRDDPDTGSVALDVDPIESFFPQTGEGSTCTEEVGVDLIPGYSAILTINGVRIPDEETNAYTVNAQGVREFSAGGSLGQFTWGPEEGCPNGRILRPQDNRLEACVYRNIDGPDACRTYVHTFDAL